MKINQKKECSGKCIQAPLLVVHIYFQLTELQMKSCYIFHKYPTAQQQSFQAP